MTETSKRMLSVDPERWAFMILKLFKNLSLNGQSHHIYKSWYHLFLHSDLVVLSQITRNLENRQKHVGQDFWLYDWQYCLTILHLLIVVCADLTTKIQENPNIQQKSDKFIDFLVFEIVSEDVWNDNNDKFDFLKVLLLDCILTCCS
jgi:hypothetical protein